MLVGPREAAAAARVVAVAGLLLGCSFMQPDPSSSPVVLTGRVEIVNEGVALALPDGWQAEPVSISHDDPGPVTRRQVLDVRHDYGPGGCTLRVETTQDESLTTLAAYTKRLIADYERDPEMTGTYSRLRLPAGSATRATFAYDYQDPPIAFRLPAQARRDRLSARMRGPRSLCG